MQVSERVLETDEPVIGKTKALMAGVEGVLSLAQGPQDASPLKDASLIGECHSSMQLLVACCAGERCMTSSHMHVVGAAAATVGS